MNKIIFLVGVSNGGKSTTLNALKGGVRQRKVVNIAECDVYIKNMSNCDECFTLYIQKIKNLMKKHKIIIVSLCIDLESHKCNADMEDICQQINALKAEKYFFVIQNGKYKSIDLSLLNCFNYKDKQMCNNQQVGCVDKFSKYLSGIDLCNDK